jgi:hypothetical protein
MLGNALRQHSSLVDFNWLDVCSLEEESQNTTLDPVLLALPTCPHLQKVNIATRYAGADAVKNLLQLPTNTALTLVVTPDHCLAVADEIRLGRFLIKDFGLCMFQGASSKAAKAVKAVASAIREDHHLETLMLQIEDGLTGEASVALAAALTINKTLRLIILDNIVFETKASLGAQAYEAFGAMLRVNTSIKLDLPPFDDAVGDEKDIDYFNQMCIEERLNGVSRGRLLASSQTPREEWINALQELNAPNNNDLFEIGCLYSLLRLNPSVCLLEFNDTTNTSL